MGKMKWRSFIDRKRTGVSTLPTRAEMEAEDIARKAASKKRALLRMVKMAHQRVLNKKEETKYERDDSTAVAVG